MLGDFHPNHLEGSISFRMNDLLQQGIRVSVVLCVCGVKVISLAPTSLLSLRCCNIAALKRFVFEKIMEVTSVL